MIFRGRERGTFNTQWKLNRLKYILCIVVLDIKSDDIFKVEFYIQRKLLFRAETQ